MKSTDYHRMSQTSPVEATAGSTGKGDAFIRITSLKQGAGIDILLESKVKSLYGDVILKTIEKKLKELAVTDVRVEVKYEAAFDYVLNARLETAVRRAFKARQK